MVPWAVAAALVLATARAAEIPMQLYLFSQQEQELWGARCLDGSPAGCADTDTMSQNGGNIRHWVARKKGRKGERGMAQVYSIHSKAMNRNRKTTEEEQEEGGGEEEEGGGSLEDHGSGWTRAHGA